MGNPSQNHEVKFNAIAHVIQVEIGTGLQMQGHEMVTFQDKSGAFRMTLPRGMVPFGEIGDKILLQIGITKGEVVATSAILQVIK